MGPVFSYKFVCVLRGFPYKVSCFPSEVFMLGGRPDFTYGGRGAECVLNTGLDGINVTFSPVSQRDFPLIMDDLIPGTLVQGLIEPNNKRARQKSDFSVRL